MPSERRAFISLGAGVQSTVMLLLADRGKLAPRPEAAIFADTQWEPRAVYDHLNWLEDVVSIPIYRVGNRSLYDDTHNGVNIWNHAYTTIPTFARMPDGSVSLRRRHCTTQYKIKPIRQKIRALVGRGRVAAEQWMGITTDEAHRMRDSDVQWLTNSYPLIELGLSRSDCLAWFAREYPGQPLAKSSCVGCPFHADTDWLRLAREAPDEMERAIALDERLRDPDRPVHRKDHGYPQFLHRTAVPLREALERLEYIDGLGQQLDFGDAFANECMGVCNV